MVGDLEGALEGLMLGARLGAKDATVSSCTMLNVALGAARTCAPVEPSTSTKTERSAPGM